LYYILIRRLIQAQPTVFEDIKGAVFLITAEVLPMKGQVVVPGDDILSLVDADGESCIPNGDLFDAPNLRILLMSPPGNRRDRKWLTQNVMDSTTATFVMEPWSREELVVASFVHSVR